MGTTTRPCAGIPNRLTSRRAEFCDTTATRSPKPTPRASSLAAWAVASSAMRR